MTINEKTGPAVTARTTLEELEELSVAALEILARQDGPDAIPLEEIPGRGEVTAWLGEVFTDRGGRLRQRSSMVKGASRAGRGLNGLLKWHRSGGNLDGLYFAKWTAGADFDKIATLASVVMALAGSSSSAAAAWRRTGLIGENV